MCLPCVSDACSSSFSLLLLSSLSGVKWLKNDLKTSPPKVFFFGRFFEFFNKQTPRHFLAVFYTRSRTTHKKHSEKKKKKKKKREKERLGRESSRLGGFYGGIGRGVTRFVVFC